MKRIFRILVLAVIAIAIISVFAVSAVETPEAEKVEAERAANVTYDVGHYGVSSPEIFEQDADITYPKARYKRNRSDRSAVHKYGSVVSHGGGWAHWYVICVSDGKIATEESVIADYKPARTTAAYVDETYGTTGYTNRIHIKGCRGSKGSGITVSNASWCPDASGVQ